MKERRTSLWLEIAFSKVVRHFAQERRGSVSTASSAWRRVSKRPRAVASPSTTRTAFPSLHCPNSFPCDSSKPLRRVDRAQHGNHHCRRAATITVKDHLSLLRSALKQAHLHQRIDHQTSVHVRLRIDQPTTLRLNKSMTTAQVTNEPSSVAKSFFTHVLRKSERRIILCRSER